MPLSKIQFGNTGRRNLIINGAMQVAQRGDQASITNAYTGVDRWKFDRTGAAVVTGKRGGSGVSTSENGFPSSVHIDVTTADSSVAAGDLGLLRQYIESQNLQSLQFGTSAAKSLTLSFWVKSPKTGTHWVEIYAYDAAKFNSASYTVSSANTWEKKTVTFAGETSTAIPSDNTPGFVIQWWLMAGSTYSSGTHAGNVWHATNANRAPGQVNVLDSTSNNFYLTGVQLEVGSSASDFEHRSYGEELHACYRYFFRMRADGGGDHNNVGIGTVASNDYVFAIVDLPTTMRVSPSVSYSALSDLRWTSVFSGSSGTPTSLGIGYAHATKPTLSVQKNGAGSGYVGEARLVGFSGTTTGYIDFSSEL